MAARLMGELSAALRRADRHGASESLTRRELQVLTLVADGLPNRAVASELHISENTVKNHMRNVHEKLGVHTRTEAVVKAARDGLLGLR
jgi:two-component system NarL family response regulator